MPPVVRVAQLSTGGWVIVVQHNFHQEYGCSYPMTYKFNIPQSSFNNLLVCKKYSSDSCWTGFELLTPNSLFNGIEGVRFDSMNSVAYISAAFSWDTDSLFLRISSQSGGPIPSQYEGICKYYDNRSAVVTTSFDDWDSASAVSVIHVLNIFRSFGLYMTGGIITQRCSQSTWLQIQQELDSGYVEAASHSRTHQQTPYQNAVSEVEGSDSDIVNNLNLPPLFKMKEKNYVYTWISPYSDFDATVDSLLGVAYYIIPRQVSDGYSTFNSWNSKRNHFYQTPTTVEVGATPWVGGDTVLIALDSAFDAVISGGGIYHLMFHPQVVDPDTNKQYLFTHLRHISGRTNIWYVCFGHLYLYHLIQIMSSNSVSYVSDGDKTVDGFTLFQNYPNPFNPETTIGYQLSAPGHVTLKVYDLLGRQITTLVNSEQVMGYHEVKFDGAGLASGVYFYRLLNGDSGQAGRMLLLK